MKEEIDYTIGLFNNAETLNDVDILRARISRIKSTSNEIEKRELLVIEAAINVLESEIKENRMYCYKEGF